MIEYDMNYYENLSCVDLVNDIQNTYENNQDNNVFLKKSVILYFWKNPDESFKRKRKYVSQKMISKRRIIRIIWDISKKKYWYDILSKLIKMMKVFFKKTITLIWLLHAYIKLNFENLIKNQIINFVIKKKKFSSV